MVAGLLLVFAGCCLLAVFAQLRVHQERVEPRPWWQAWAPGAWLDYRHPERFTTEGLVWRRVLLAATLGAVLLMVLLGWAVD